MKFVVGGSSLEPLMLCGSDTSSLLSFRVTYIYLYLGVFDCADSCRGASSRMVHFLLKEHGLVEFRMSVGRMLKFNGPETVNAFAPVCVLRSVSLSHPFPIGRL